MFKNPTEYKQCRAKKQTYSSAHGAHCTSAQSIMAALIGFKQDCEELIKQFELTEDIRFETFVKLWKEKQFSLVFTWCRSLSDLQAFCEEGLHICKQYVLSTTHFKQRICALYILYGFYYKMPIDTFKIRVNCDEWQIITEFHQDIRLGEHVDASYVLSKLIADGAFHFCLFDKEHGLEKPYRKKKQHYLNYQSVTALIKSLSEPDNMFSTINNLSRVYEKYKKDLTDQSGVSTPNLYNASVFESLNSKVEELTKSIQEKAAVNTSEPKRSERYSNVIHQKLNVTTDFDSESSDEDDVCPLNLKADSDSLD
ncbi:snRNA-activating protein complex subunit 1 [Prorops nasuta]|uniref:snRNA-activating protein complex subunit 1 n=1 Tax=Prorops nasuta TaxID=863751 RepID=UPI0034CD63C2